jgi:hypothetical protein
VVGRLALLLMLMLLLMLPLPLRPLPSWRQGPPRQLQLQG